MTKDEFIVQVFKYRNNEITQRQMLDAVDAYTSALLEQCNVSGELPIYCVNDFEKPEYCSQRNNHLCQKCKDW